ncbi:MAG: hypothetical protein ABMB14_23590 [Myxococcota bacterium]
MKLGFLVLAAGCAGDPPTDGGTDGPPTCNGASCDRPFDALALAIAHNAMNVEDEGWALPNQHVGYEQQVADGIRGFMLDVYDVDGVPTLCHAACSLGSEPLATALDRFAALLDANPGDVFVFVIQDELDYPLVVDAFDQSALAGRLIGEVDGWPTVGALVEADTRLLVTHEQPRPGAPAWYHPAYELAWDNDYAAASVEDFDCAVLRGDASNDVFLLNHFLTNGVASPELADEANPYDVILDHADRCEAEAGDLVNWIAVDFYDQGDVFGVVDALNARRDP